MKLHVPANRITSILNGKRGISAETALRLACFLGTTPEFWINLQTTFDLKMEYKCSWHLINTEIKNRASAA